MRWPWQRRAPAAVHGELAGEQRAWLPPLGTGVWRTWYGECCDALLAYQRITATLPDGLREPAGGLADQLDALLEEAQDTAELGARLDPHGPWPDPRLVALLAEDTIADLGDHLPPDSATDRLAELLDQQRKRLDELVDELTRLAAHARENPAATDVDSWLSALATGITEASRAGWTGSTLPRRRLKRVPARAAEPVPAAAAQLGAEGWEWYPELSDERLAAGLPEPPDVVSGLRYRCLAAQSAALRYHAALAEVVTDAPAATALAAGWPPVVAQVERVYRLATLTERAPWTLPAPRRRGPRRIRYPAAARHLHNLHRALVVIELSTRAAVRVAVATALAGQQPPDRAGTDVQAALTALGAALDELSTTVDQ